MARTIVDADVPRQDFSGLADVLLTSGMNLTGTPSLSRADFRHLRHQPHPILGLRTRTVAPTGQYD